MNGEVFCDYSTHEISETRLVPAGFNFRLASKAGLGLYYTWQEFRSGGEWYTRHIINTALTISL